MVTVQRMVTRKPPPTAKTLTVSVIEEQYGIPRRTTLAAIERGALKATQLPGSRGAYLIEPKDFAAWQKRRRARAERLAARNGQVSA